MAVDVRAYSLVSSLASAAVRFTGLSTLYSYWGDAIAAILGTADFYAPLTTSLVPEKGTGQATFTRGTTATVEVNDGANGLILRTAQIGEARFPGARRVENLLQNTTTLATQSVTVVSGNTYTLSFWGTGSVALSGAYSSTLAGTGAGNRVQTTFTAASTALTLTVTGSVTSAQLENVTGQADQSAGEYVSNGVLSYPYHGAGVDGVAYFDTLLDGSKIPDAMLKGVLVEGSRTNLLPWSACDTTHWELSGAIVSQLALNALGVFPGVRVASQGYVYNRTFYRVNVTSGIQYAITLYYIVGTSGTVRITLAANGGESYAQGTPGSLSSVNSVAGTVTIVKDTEVAGGVFQVSIIFVPTITTLMTVGIGPYSSVSGKDVIALGAQVEAGSFPSSYIPTVAATVTRNTDVLTYPTTGNVVSEQGVAYAETQMDGVYVDRRPLALSASNNNRVQMPLDKGVFGTGSGVVGTGLLIPNSNRRKVAIRWIDGGKGSFFYDGAKAADTASNIAPIVDRIDVGGSSVGTTTSFFGTIRNVRVWKSVLADSDLQSITK